MTVIHPKFVGRPVGDACDDEDTLDAASTSVTDTEYYNDGKRRRQQRRRQRVCDAVGTVLAAVALQVGTN